jgi:predicted Zn-ribbon and HTH transcriptional regulator
MIVIDSIVKTPNEDKILVPILNITCKKCASRWSHDSIKGTIHCKKCGNNEKIEEALKNLVNQVLMHGGVQ